jgi:hypothetical protein
MCKRAVEYGEHPFGIASARRVDAIVFEWLVDYADWNQRIDAETRKGPPTPVGSAGDYAERIAALDRKLGALTVHLASGLVPEPAYVVARDEITAQRTVLAGQLQREQDRALLMSAAPHRAASDLLAEWPTIPAQVRRAALRELVDSVTVTPGGYRAATFVQVNPGQ